MRGFSKAERFRPMWALAINVGITFIAFAVVGISVWSSFHAMLEHETRAGRLNAYVRTLAITHEHAMDDLMSAGYSDRLSSLPESNAGIFLGRIVTFLIDEERALQLDLNAMRLDELNRALLTGENQAAALLSRHDLTGARAILQSSDFTDLQSEFHRRVRAAAATVREYGEQGNKTLSLQLRWIGIFAFVFCVLMAAAWIRLINLMKIYISGWREAETGLREGEERYRRLIDAMPQAVVIVHDDAIVFGNPAAATMLGYPTTRSMIGVRALARVAEREHGRLNKFIDQCRSGKLDEDAPFNLVMVRSDQEEFPAEIFARSIQFNGASAIQMVAVNIADRQRTEAVLRESEARFRNLADNAPVLIWMAGAARHTFYFNKTWLKFTGRTLSQDYGLGWQEQLHPEDLERCLSVYKIAFAAHRPFTVEYRLRHADGTYHWLLDSGAPRFTADGVFTGFIGSCVDITDRRVAEEAMRSSERKFRELTDLLPQTIFEIDLTGRLTFVNRHAIEMFGYEQSDFERGLNAFDMVSGPDLEVVRSRFVQILKGERLGSNEYRMRKKDGSLFPALIDSVVIEADGKPVGARGIIVDITRQKQVEVEINILSRAIDSSPDGVLIADLDGRITYLNKGLLAISHSRSASDLIGKSLDEISEPGLKEFLRKDVLPQLAGGKPWSGELSCRRADGTLAELELSCSAILDDAGNSRRLLANLRDISPRKQSERRMARLNACLLSFGPDPTENINRLTEFCGETMNATAAMYNCIRECTMVSIGKWHTPEGLTPSGPEAGHLCYDVITQPGDGIFVARHLLESSYADTDPNVRQYQLQTYLGQPVKCQDKNVGSLCVVYQRDFIPTAEDAALMGIIASAIGVEEVRKREQEQLIHADERFRTSVENMLDPFSILSAVRDDRGMIVDFRCDYINEAGCNHLKRARDQIVGHRLLEVYPWQKDIGLFDAYCRIVEYGEPFASDTIQFEKMVDGSPVLIAFDVSATRMGDGITTSWRDVTARQVAEASVRQKTRELEAIFNVLPDLYFRITQDAVIVDYRAGARDKLYAPPEAFLGHRLSDVLPPDVAELISNAIRTSLTENRFSRVTYALTMGGRTTNFEARLFPYSPEEVVAFVRDTSVYSMAQSGEAGEQTLVAARLEDLERDLREPLELMAGYADLIRRRYAEQLDRDAGSMLEAICNGTSQIRSLIDAIHTPTGTSSTMDVR